LCQSGIPTVEKGYAESLVHAAPSVVDGSHERVAAGAATPRSNDQAMAVACASFGAAREQFVTDTPIIKLPG
jgi:hypothetical protein